MTGTNSNPMVAVDCLKDRDKVLVLFAAHLAVATVSPSEANRLERTPLGQRLEYPHWGIPLANITEMKGKPTGLELTFQDRHGNPSTLTHTIDQQLAQAFLERIQAQSGGTWEKAARRSSAMTAVLVSWGFAILLAAITALLYFGIQGGWIQRAPSIIVTIYDLLGLNGILAVGGIGTLLFVFTGLKAMIAPGQDFHLTRIG